MEFNVDYNALSVLCGFCLLVLALLLSDFLILLC